MNAGAADIRHVWSMPQSADAARQIRYLDLAASHPALRAAAGSAKRFLAGPRRLLDLGCGLGDFVLESCSGRSPGTSCHGLGLDLHPRLLQEALRRARRCSAPRIAFVQGDAHCLPLA